MEGIAKTTCLLSIHRVYCDRILSGVKKYEFRKRCPEWLRSGCEMVLFSSDAPETLLAMFEVGAILSGTPEEIWQRAGAEGGIDHESYLRYYENQPVAFAFEIRNVRRFAEGNALASIVGGAIVPHSFVLLSAEQVKAIHNCLVCPSS